MARPAPEPFPGPHSNGCASRLPNIIDSGLWSGTWSRSTASCAMRRSMRTAKRGRVEKTSPPCSRRKSAAEVERPTGAGPEAGLDSEAVETAARRTALQFMGQTLARTLNADHGDDHSPRLPCTCGHTAGCTARRSGSEGCASQPASSNVEAGCRTIVGTCLKRSGMHWTVEGANAILALRCAILSNRFDDFRERRAAHAP